jgi:hypothetical protein
MDDEGVKTTHIWPFKEKKNESDRHQEGLLPKAF